MLFQAEGIARALGDIPGVVGVVLDGGLSRGYGDHLSEIDLIVYVDREPTDVPVPRGIVILDGALADVTVLRIDSELDRERDRTAVWDLSYALVLRDPTGQVRDMLDAIVEQPPGPAAAAGPLFEAWWCFRLAGDAWIYRGDGLQAHAVLNNALAPLLEALFLLNNEYVPHLKWRVHLSRSLAWTPVNWEAGLHGAMLTGDGSTDAAKVRQSAIGRLWDSIDRRVRDLAFPALPATLSVTQQWHYELLAWVAREGSVTTSQWEERASVSDLYQEPFHSCTRREGDVVTFVGHAAGRPAGGMYDWHAQVADAVLGKVPSDS